MTRLLAETRLVGMDRKIGAGQLVSVLTVTGERRQVRAVSEGPGVIYVTSEAEYERAVAENRDPEAFIGFPRADVAPL